MIEKRGDQRIIHMTNTFEGEDAGKFWQETNQSVEKLNSSIGHSYEKLGRRKRASIQHNLQDDTTNMVEIFTKGLSVSGTGRKKINTSRIKIKGNLKNKTEQSKSPSEDDKASEAQSQQPDGVP